MKRNLVIISFVVFGAAAWAQSTDDITPSVIVSVPQKLSPAPAIIVQSQGITPRDGLEDTLEKAVNPIPMDAKSGVMQFLQFPDVMLNKKEMRLGPGTRIWNINFTSIMPATLYQQTWYIRYDVGINDTPKNVWLIKQK